MAAGAEVQQRSMSGGSSRRANARAASEIRFSDVAHYVGLSLLRDPSMTRSPPKAGLRIAQVPGLEKEAPASLPRTPAMESPSPSSKAGDLPQIHQSQADRMRCQLEWLRAEQRAEKEQLRKLETCVSDSTLIANKAQRRASKHKEMRDFHQQRAADVEAKINRLKQELGVRDGQSQKSAARQSNESHSQAWAGTEDGGRSGPGMLANAYRASSSQSTGALRREEGSWQKSHEEGRRAQTSPGARSDLEETLPLESPDMNPGSGGEAISRDLPPVSPATAEVEGVEGGGEAAAAEGVGEEGAAQGAAAPEAAAALEDGAGEGATETARPETSGSHSRAEEGKKASPKARPSPTSSVQQVPATQDLPEEELQEHHRTVIRTELVRAAKGAREAFKKIDLNGSGNISSQEFADGVKSMGVPWQDITGLRRDRDLFKLFDTDKDAVITFAELFPEESAAENAPRRVSTPEFWKTWVRKNQNAENMERGPRWQPENQEEEMQLLFDVADSKEEVDLKRKWMAATMRRLKSRGKSDARCREVIALHLPRGTGPKDREDVPTFSGAEVRACKKQYTDQVLNPARNIQKLVIDMKEQSKILKSCRQKLWAVTMEPSMRARAEEDRKAVNPLSAGLGMMDKAKDDDSASGSKGGHGGQKSLKAIAQECKMDDDVVEDLYKDFNKFADTNEMINRKGFTRMLQGLCPNRTLADNDVEAWWNQVTRGTQGEDGDGKGDERRSASSGRSGKRAQCAFAQFAEWWATSEART
mmetsp:Transcript_22046/g.48197  ORF Transcript_22046/g.48197 Transcript_22046/m.48197 type:complete len:760 (-) Transcript_22046:47-2326(-)